MFTLIRRTYISSIVINCFLITSAVEAQVEISFADFYEMHHVKLDDAIEKGNADLIFLNAKEILDLLLRNNSHEEDWDYFFGLIRSSSESSTLIDYYAYKIIIHSKYSQKEYDNIGLTNWSFMLEAAKTEKDTSLLISINNLWAVYEEMTNKDYGKAKELYQNTIEWVESNKELSNFHFSAINNIANLEQKQGNFNEAIKIYKKGTGINSSSNNYFQNLHRLYGWISESYKEIGELDSAYFYQDLRHTIYLKGEKLKNDVAISELQEKYQNEKLSKEITEEKLQNNKLLTTAISLGSLFGISLLGLWGYRRFSQLQQRTLKQEIIDTQQKAELTAINAQLDGAEEERRRVANVLHDGISSHLSAAALQLQFLTNSHTHEHNIETDKIEELISEAADQSRRLSHELYPPVLIKEGLIVAVSRLADNYSMPELEFVMEADDMDYVLPSEWETKLYYIINELLQNVLKHSQASMCKIEFTNSDAEIRIMLTDNGVGINAPSEGLGLQTINARVKSMDGSFDYFNLSEGGLNTTITLPLSLDNTTVLN